VDTEVVVALIAVFLLMIPAGLMFWAMWRSTTLTERLHPLTPKQRAVKRKVYALTVPVVAVILAIEFALARAGVLVVVAVFGGILLLDAVLTPWLHYRRSKRRRPRNKTTT